MKEAANPAPRGVEVITAPIQKAIEKVTGAAKK